MSIGLPFPNLDPVAISIGPVAIHWYALAYITGFVGGMYWAEFLVKRYAGDSPVKRLQIDDLLFYIIIGIILGGRIFYVLFYNLPYYAEHPLESLRLWEGGMSFHGGLTGTIVAMFLYARAKGFKFFEVADVAAAVTPIGLFFGRLANFVNDELWGRVTDVPWAVRFPNGGDLPRHPSQLYEAGLEGFVLFIVLFLLARRAATWQKRGLLAGVFMAGYGIARLVVEFVREPDAQLGFLFGGVTMGQLLCLPMIACGGLILWWRNRLP